MDHIETRRSGMGWKGILKVTGQDRRGGRMGIQGYRTGQEGWMDGNSRLQDKEGWMGGWMGIQGYRTGQDRTGQDGV
jgi:hypothetical protein